MGVVDEEQGALVVPFGEVGDEGLGDGSDGLFGHEADRAGDLLEGFVWVC